MFKLVKTLKAEGISRPWRLAFNIAIKHKYLPRRSYLSLFIDGFRY
jgi:hypothetical protein